MRCFSFVVVVFLQIFYMETRSFNFCHCQRVYREITEGFISLEVAFSRFFILIILRSHAELTLVWLFRNPLLQESLSATSPMTYTLSVIFSTTHTGPRLSSPWSPLFMPTLCPQHPWTPSIWRWSTTRMRCCSSRSVLTVCVSTTD